MPEYITRSEEETIALGKRLAGELPDAAVVILTGNLGAGKTTLAKGLAEGRDAACPREVSSPTFTLIHEYGDPPTVYHVDLYRIESEAQLATLGLDEILSRNALVLIEWGEKFPGLFPDGAWRIEIERIDENRRGFRIRPAKPS